MTTSDDSPEANIDAPLMTTSADKTKWQRQIATTYNKNLLIDEPFGSELVAI
jgi:hypothetical protein